MKIRPEVVRDVAALVGGLGLVGGAWWVYQPAGVIVGAGLCIALALYIERHIGRGKPK